MTGLMRRCPVTTLPCSCSTGCEEQEKVARRVSQERLQPFRTDARTTDRIEKLEAVREAAKAFLEALDTDPGFPMKRQEALRTALVEAEP